LPALFVVFSNGRQSVYFMKAITKMVRWGDGHHPGILDLIRIVLGVFLMVKGIIFVNNAPYLRYLIIENQAIEQPESVITAIIVYVTYVHIVGGAGIILGLFTRLSALVQLPAVFGAVFLVNILSSFVNSELWLSILVLALLILFVIIGSGPISLDRLIATKIAEKNENS
jgi:putative oxidoreductase